MKKLIFCSIICTTLLACGDYQHETIPSVPVNFTINLNDVTYMDLNHYGGHIYVTGGVCGIIIYRLNESEFMAYDRACPYDWQEDDSWLEVDGIIIRCTKCNSRFNILDGSVISGPAIYNLKYYKANYYYNSIQLHVYN